MREGKRNALLAPLLCVRDSLQPAAECRPCLILYFSLSLLSSYMATCQNWFSTPTNSGYKIRCLVFSKKRPRNKTKKGKREKKTFFFPPTSSNPHLFSLPFLRSPGCPAVKEQHRCYESLLLQLLSPQGSKLIGLRRGKEYKREKKTAFTRKGSNQMKNPQPLK